MQGKNHNYYVLFNQHVFIGITILLYTNKEQIEFTYVFSSNYLFNRNKKTLKNICIPTTLQFFKSTNTVTLFKLESLLVFFMEHLVIKIMCLFLYINSRNFFIYIVQKFTIIFFYIIVFWFNFK